MIPHVMQGWTTLRIKSLTSVRQSASEWLDLEGFRDLTMWIHVADVTAGGVARLDLETSPSEDATLFQPLSTQATFTTLNAAGVYVAVSRANVAAVPLSRYLRWALTSVTGVDCNITFRVLLSLNPIGREFRVAAGDETFSNLSLSATEV